MKVAEALREAAQRLEPVSDTARLDAELLMAHALGVSRSEMLLRHMNAASLDRFDRLVERRAAHEPIAYITGIQEFFGREFAVTRGLLIPRADSETTLLAALDAASDARRVLDCGTGPGTLLISFLAECPEAEGIGVDASSLALGVAAANVEQLRLTGRVQFLRRDWTQPGWRDGLGQFDLILANPPYVEEGAELAPDVRGWEPAGALFAGKEGLDDYRVLIPQLPALLAEGGVAVLEIGAAQDEAVAGIAAEAGFESMLRRDLAGRPRALVLRLALGK